MTDTAKKLSPTQQAALNTAADDHVVRAGYSTLQALKNRGLVIIEVREGRTVKTNGRSTRTLHDETRTLAEYVGVLTDAGREVLEAQMPELSQRQEAALTDATDGIVRSDRGTIKALVRRGLAELDSNSGTFPLTRRGRQVRQRLLDNPRPEPGVNDPWPTPKRQIAWANVPSNPGIREAVAATVVDALGRLAETPEAFADLIADGTPMEEIKALLRLFAGRLPGDHWDRRLEER